MILNSTLDNLPIASFNKTKNKYLNFKNFILNLNILILLFSFLICNTGLDGNKLVQEWNIAHHLQVSFQACSEFDIAKVALVKAQAFEFYPY